MTFALTACLPVVPSTSSTVTLDQTQLTITQGQSVVLKATSSIGNDITWVSSSEEIVIVSASGIVTGLSVGQAVVTATDGKAMANCAVTVNANQSPNPDVTPDPDKPDTDPYHKDGYKLTFQDEFDGETLDTTKWGYMLGVQDHYGNEYGPMNWGNGELQYYTEGDNVEVNDGTLKIIARKEQRESCNYTSSRICTRDKFSQTFGYFEARMKLPIGSGLWPAFWLMPQPSSKDGLSNAYGGWAASGEIDIMENKGRLPNKIDNTIHYGGGWPNNKLIGKSTTLSSPVSDWHIYALEWTYDKLTWLVDGIAVYTVSSDVYYSTASDSPAAPFDQPFYVILNLAVGGSYDPQGTQEFLTANNFVEACVQVDFVRVYQRLDYVGQVA